MIMNVLIFQLGKASDKEKETEAFDSQAMKYLSFLLAPLCIGGAVYSLLYTPHKRYRTLSICLSVCPSLPPSVGLSQAMKYLSFLLAPLCIGGAVYSLLYTPHKRYSTLFVRPSVYRSFSLSIRLSVPGHEISRLPVGPTVYRGCFLTLETGISADFDFKRNVVPPWRVRQAHSGSNSPMTSQNVNTK